MENVRGFLDPVFDEYRAHIKDRLEGIGYQVHWTPLNASDYGVPQLRPRSVLVALQQDFASFKWPEPVDGAPTGSEAPLCQMASRGWKVLKLGQTELTGSRRLLWAASMKHGGPDLGPTRAKRAWAELGVDGLGLADAPPPVGV